MGLVRQVRSGELSPIANESAAAAVVARESAEVSEAEMAVTPAPAPGDGVLAEIDEVAAGPEAELHDDLQRIEGIGPKVATILNEDGIVTFVDLASAGEDRLRRLLEEAGIRSAYIGTWPEQARLAAAGQWTELESYNSNLKASRKR
jgi:predicted flap endonuclease-1-like 5' DNA nuclease